MADGARLKEAVALRAEVLESEEWLVTSQQASLKTECELLVNQHTLGDLSCLFSSCSGAEESGTDEFDSLLFESGGPENKRLTVKLICQTVDLMNEFLETESKVNTSLEKLAQFYSQAADCTTICLVVRKQLLNSSYLEGRKVYTVSMVGAGDWWNRLTSQEMTSALLIDVCKQAVRTWDLKRCCLADHLGLLEAVCPEGLPTTLPKHD